MRLTELGDREAREAGRMLAEAGIDFDIAFTSLLSRAIKTLWLSLEEMDLMWLPVIKHWRLNERHYGKLQGDNKKEAVEKFGEEQVKIWRRSYDTPPPPMAPGGPFDLSGDRRYAGVALPATESLKTTLERVEPYWREDIAPKLKSGETLLIAAHGNSLRAIVKLLFAVADADIVGVEIPTGNPLLIELDANLTPLSACYLDPSRAEPLPAPPARTA